MDFLTELRWRGMIHDQTPGIEAELAKGGRTGYIGFDPTAPGLGIGNYVQLMLLTLFQRSGHRPIMLMGGATGRIGDPSGKDRERQLKSYEELDGNLARQVEQARKFLDFDGPKGALLVNNLDFYKGMDFLTFLRDVGKHLTVNYMLSKESVQRRLETGISFTEFSYQLLQGYDYRCLYEQHGCTVQMGGSDQFGNILAGLELTRRMSQAEVFGVVTPLLTKADGSKFGKSEKGNLWLDPAQTSPYKFYQFWLNADDRDLGKFTRYFSFRSQEEVEALENEIADPRERKRLLAEELTVRIHSQADYGSVLRVSELLFDPCASRESLLVLDRNALATVAEEIPAFKIPAAVLADGINVCELLAEKTTILPSKSETRRAISGQALSLNKVKINSHEQMVNHESLLHGKYLLVENGKKNKAMIVAE